MSAEERPAGLLEEARAGDHAAFTALVMPHHRALHLHCYRMLGSLDQAEEALQETWLRAWRSLDTYADRAPLHHWLHRIATTTCLKIIERRRHLPTTLAEVGHLQPYPDILLEELDPAVIAEQRESVALAFITALQLLPATQRAVVILREVLSWSATEVAAFLGTSVPAVNSSLQRGRASLRSDTARRPRPLEAYERQLVRRFVHSWQHRDFDALAALLREDVILRMPPDDVEFDGRAAVMGFLTRVPAEGRLDLIRLVETAANGLPALAAYLPGPGSHQGYGVMLLSTTAQGIAEIIGFRGAGLLRWFALPPEIGQDPEGPRASGGAQPP